MPNSTIVESNRIIYTPSSFARSSLIHLQEIGTSKAKQPHTNSRSRLNSYLFMIIEDGEGIIKQDNRIYTLRKGDCAFLSCSKGYSHTTSRDNLWTIRWIHMWGANLDAIYNKYLERGGNIIFTPSNLSVYNSIWESVYDTAASSDYIRDMRIYEELVRLLTAIMSVSWNSDRTSHNLSIKRDISDIRTYIDTHCLDSDYTDTLSLDALSSRFYINKYYLVKLFKQNYGSTINAYIHNKKITHAKYLLRFSDKSISEISEECGISDSNYFSRMFKSVEGVSPAKYRLEW